MDGAAAPGVQVDVASVIAMCASPMLCGVVSINGNRPLGATTQLTGNFLKSAGGWVVSQRGCPWGRTGRERLRGPLSRVRGCFSLEDSFSVRSLIYGYTPRTEPSFRAVMGPDSLRPLKQRRFNPKNPHFS